MGDTAAAELVPASSERAPVRLRARLWKQHVRLQELDPSSAEYQQVGDEVLELTADLIRVEAARSHETRAARRRTGALLYGVGAALLLAAIVLATLI